MAVKQAERSVKKPAEDKKDKTIKTARTTKAVKKPADKKTSKKKSLVIIESPNKVKTLKKILGQNYKIESSVGHVRDLPKSEMGIDVANNFEPKYITIRGKGDILANLRKEAKDSDKIYLATDPDREGEAIAWHLMYALKLDEAKTRRITFNELTKNTVLKSLKEARDINMDLVNAQQARRTLDRIVGYKMSPLLWHKVKRGLSAGRVQSVAVRLICDREDEIRNFTPEEYWTADADLVKASGQEIKARYGKDRVTEAEAREIVENTKGKDFAVTDVSYGSRVKKPNPPFTTSSMQQEAAKRLGFATNKTMLVAQQLYEGVDIQGEGSIGLVSYIRTDSVRVADEAHEDAKAYISSVYGENYASAEKPEYKSKGRAQDAHEAIRPANARLSPESIKASLTREQFKLYELIWKRFIASQMTPAVFDTVSAKISCGGYLFRASGMTVKFDGYRVLDISDEDEKAEFLAGLTAGETLTLKKLNAEKHFTQPPPRYSDASLVKTLEENGVGRPSTIAPTISTIISRNYVTKENKVYYPTELGETVNEIMSKNFEDIVNVDFTASMERELDKVEDGEVEWKDIIGRFYYPFDEKIKEAEEKLGSFEVRDEETDIKCELCGRNMVIKFGRYGKFLACPGFPECKNAKPYFEDAGVACPLCGGKIQIKKTKKGRVYYGCENGPSCEFISWNKPADEKCPECGGYMVIKGTKNKKICCANAECGYSREIAEDEEE